MNAVLLILPLTIIRYGIPLLISKEAVERTSFFPPVEGREKLVLNTYKIMTILLLVMLFFFDAKLTSTMNHIGLAFYVFGMLCYIVAITNFARAEENEIIQRGLYKFSRNPMYVAFFLYFLGIDLMIASWLYFIILIICTEDLSF